MSGNPEQLGVGRPIGAEFLESLDAVFEEVAMGGIYVVLKQIPGFVYANSNDLRKQHDLLDLPDAAAWQEHIDGEMLRASRVAGLDPELLAHSLDFPIRLIELQPRNTDEEDTEVFRVNIRVVDKPKAHNHPGLLGHERNAFRAPRHLGDLSPESLGDTIPLRRIFLGRLKVRGSLPDGIGTTLRRRLPNTLTLERPGPLSDQNKSFGQRE